MIQSRPFVPSTIEVVIPGIPQQQGSMVRSKFGGIHSANKNLAPWRRDAILAIQSWMGQRPPLLGPLSLTVEFMFNRPASHFGTGRNAGVLKASAPASPSTTPDLDKLLRAVCDSMTQAGAWRDDAQVVRVTASKVYADRPRTHLVVEVLK